MKAGKFGFSTLAINGGLECHGGGYQFIGVKRFGVYKNVLKAFNVNEVPIENGCYN